MAAISAMTPGARSEAELLICCARTCLDTDTAERIRALIQHDLDWAYLLRTALAHGMLPLLYWHLNATCPEALPGLILEQLRDHFHGNTGRNRYMAGELLDILHLFEAHGIFAIPYKGPALTASVYGNLGLREFVDLDLLVHKQDVRRAKDLLASKGYQPQFHLTEAQEAGLLRSQCEYLLWRDEDGVIAEIQWGIVPRYFAFPLDYERLWERLEPVSLGGKSILTLAPEDLLLILCVHGTKHLWEQLKWICDIAGLIHLHNKMDWEQVMAQAGTLGSRRMLFLGLFLASDLLGASLPKGVLKRVKADAAVKALAAQVHERLFREANGLPGLCEASLFHLRARERLRDRIHYGVRLAMTTTPGDWALLPPLPASLFPLYSLWRPVRLAGKYGLGMKSSDVES
jgi:Uncharacterised nucleotidyltransferase